LFIERKTFNSDKEAELTTAMRTLPTNLKFPSKPWIPIPDRYIPELAQLPPSLSLQVTQEQNVHCMRGEDKTQLPEN